MEATMAKKREHLMEVEMVTYKEDQKVEKIVF